MRVKYGARWQRGIIAAWLFAVFAAFQPITLPMLLCPFPLNRRSGLFAVLRPWALALGLAASVPSFGHSQNLIELNFTDAQIDAVAISVGAMLGKNVVVDPKVKGSLTLVSEQALPPQQALAQLQQALRLHGFALIDAGNILKVVPEADAKTHSTKINPGAAGGEVITQIFPLKHESAAQVLNVVKPLVSPNNVVNINPGNNALVVTDYADNVARIGRLIASLDRDSFSDVQIIPLEHAIASEMVPLLQRLIDADTLGLPPGQAAQGMAGGLRSTLIADSRSNTLIVRAANAAKLAQIRSLVQRLDQPAIQNESSAGNLHVVYLKHADAVSLAETLRAAMLTLEQSAPVQSEGAGRSSLGASGSATSSSGMSSNASSGGDGGGLGQASPLSLGQEHMPSTGGQVQADPNTNSLIITAPAPLYRQLRAVIDKLDSRRAQVLVESMIVEVSDNKLAEFGVQWQATLGDKGNTLGAIGTNSNVAGGNILGIMAGLASGDTQQMASALNSLGSGMNIALAPKALGQYYLGALANFLQQDGSSNILSRPNLMTLDNQEARIIIGNNVPFVTGSYATTGGNSTVNPFTTVERKDVGLMLRIKPTINENGTIKLVVNQEASSIDQATLTNSNGPSTNKRSIESTVLVEDGSIVMLGGLMQDSFSQGQDKVPLLGDIPIMGNLFKSQTRSHSKTNLMIFLRPIVMRDADSSNSLAMDRYREIRSLQSLQALPPSAMLGNLGSAGNTALLPENPADLSYTSQPQLTPASAPPERTSAPQRPTKPRFEPLDPNIYTPG